MVTRIRPSPGGTPQRAFELEADALRALAHPKRLMILSRLHEGGESVTELAEALEMSLPNASQHLRVLRERGFVRAERVGQVVRYRLSNPAIRTCCALVRGIVVEESRRRTEGLTVAPTGSGPIEGRPAEVLPA